MSHLTIDDLKTALVSLGIPLPSTDTEKEYIDLYKKHVSPLRNIQIKKRSKYNRLSSDDDDDTSSSKHVYTHKTKIFRRMADNILNRSEIYNLSDEQLYKELSNLNVSVGPIVDSTRKIYQRKLVKLMGGDVVESSFNGDVDNDEYSDSDSEHHTKEGNNVESEKIVRPYSSIESPSSTLRSRVTAGSSISAFDNSLSFDHARHTPSPRPSLRTASSSTTSSTSTKYITSGGILRETKSVRHTYSLPSQRGQSPEGTSSLLRRLLVKTLFIFILLAALYFTYQYLYSESPLKGLKGMAQQASDLASGNTKKEVKVKI